MRKTITFSVTGSICLTFNKTGKRNIATLYGLWVQISSHFSHTRCAHTGPFPRGLHSEREGVTRGRGAKCSDAEETRLSGFLLSPSLKNAS